VPGLVAMRRYAPVALDVGAHPGDEPWQYMVVYEFESEKALRAFASSDTFAYKQIFRSGVVAACALWPVRCALCTGQGRVAAVTPRTDNLDSTDLAPGPARAPQAAMSASGIVCGSRVLEERSETPLECRRVEMFEWHFQCNRVQGHKGFIYG
jgi:hypothetical protein